MSPPAPSTDGYAAFVYSKHTHHSPEPTPWFSNLMIGITHFERRKTGGPCGIACTGEHSIGRVYRKLRNARLESSTTRSVFRFLIKLIGIPLGR